MAESQENQYLNSLASRWTSIADELDARTSYLVRSGISQLFVLHGGLFAGVMAMNSGTPDRLTEPLYGLALLCSWVGLTLLILGIYFLLTDLPEIAGQIRNILVIPVSTEAQNKLVESYDKGVARSSKRGTHTINLSAIVFLFFSGAALLWKILIPMVKAWCSIS